MAWPTAGDSDVMNLERRSSEDRFEAMALELPQVDCRTEHTFGDGWYVRQVTIPAGTYAMGHRHRFETLNNVVSGHAQIMTEDGPVDVFAPATFTSPPGRKLVYAVTETVWQNVIATELKDPDAIEAIMVERSPKWLERNSACLLSA